MSGLIDPELVERLARVGDEPLPLFTVEPDTLFGVTQPATAAPEPEKLSPDRRRALRQAEAIANRTHPLSLALRVHIPLHADAALDREGEGLRCSGCRFRQVSVYHSRAYAKCVQDGTGRVSHGAGTDIRGWWPACRDFEAQP